MCPSQHHWQVSDAGGKCHRIWHEFHGFWSQVWNRVFIVAQLAKQQFIFLTSKKRDTPDYARLQLDHNASRACNHNAFRHSTSSRNDLRSERSNSERSVLFGISIVSGNYILGKLAKTFGWKCAAISICWYTSFRCLPRSQCPRCCRLDLRSQVPPGEQGKTRYERGGSDLHRQARRPAQNITRRR